MRLHPWWMVGLVVTGFACGKTETPDAGMSDAGIPDAGVKGPTCLPDTIDAGAGDAGWDGGYDFSCFGKPPAEGGQAELLVEGFVTRAGFTRTPTADVRVDLLSTDGRVLATATSGDGGLYSLSFDAGCAPLNGEVRATHPSPDAGFYLTWASPSAPWSRDRAGLELVLFDYSTRGLVGALANVTIADGTAVLALRVVDCGGFPVQGALVSVPGDAGVVRYVGTSGLPSSALTATTSAGDVLVFNLPGTTVDLTATLDGGVIGRRVVPIHADAASATTLAP